MLQILLSEDSPCPKNEIGQDSPIPKFIYLKIRRRDGIESLMILEEGEFKVPIDGCIKVTKGVPIDPTFAFRAFYNFRLHFFWLLFFLIVKLIDMLLLTQKNFKSSPSFSS